jgi:hypothetical protein
MNMNTKTSNKMAKGNYGRPQGSIADYRPRNTSLDKDGNVRVRGEIVCKPRGEHIRPGSFFTPKGTKPAPANTVTVEDLSGLDLS